MPAKAAPVSTSGSRRTAASILQQNPSLRREAEFPSGTGYNRDDIDALAHTISGLADLSPGDVTAG